MTDPEPDTEVPGSFAALYSSLDPRPDERGKQFERIVKWFLKSDPAWATQVDEVWLWNEWPERWGADCGIDIIFRHKNGEVWAVQAKCYSPDYTVTKHDVDRFLSESNRSLIHRRLLVATTDRIGTNAVRVSEAQEKPVVLFRLSDFNNSLLDYPSNFEHLHQSRRRPRPVPRDHQNEAITAVSNGLRDADRGQLIMACGTGKTYITLWIKEALNAQRTLVLVPSLGLLSQLLREWAFAASVPFELLCVCSDESVGIQAGDDAVHSVMDLAFGVTSDAAEVRRFLCGAGNRVVISTYQSSLVVAAAQSEPIVPAFDLAIADEAHRCAGKVGGDFSAILNSEQIRSAKRLFATATPRIYSRSVKSAAEARGVEVVGMDDNTLFGAVLYALPFGKAIERRLLTDYRVVIIGVDDATIAQWIDQRKLVSTGTGVETDSESLAAQIGLLKAMKDYDLKRVISFHSRVSRAESFITELRKVSDWITDDHRPSGELHADFVSGNMPAGKRKVKLDRLKGLKANERAVLSNARCLAEGVDVPSLDGVAFIDPRSSHVDIVQAVGRAIRLSPEKKTGTIILPVFLKSTANAVSAIEGSNFKPIWEVLDALKAHDDVLAWDLDQIRTEMGRTRGTSVSVEDLGKLGISLPSAVDESFGTALRTYLVEQVTVSWNFWFGLLEAYVKETGSAWVSARYVTQDGYKLGMWVNGQRDSKLRNRLSKDRVARLESLWGWTWNAYQEKWEISLSKLMDYVEIHGNTDVPLRYVTPDGYNLGRWVSNVRKGKLENEISTERIAKLESISSWSWGKGALDERWEFGFKALEQYVKEFGHSRVPAHYVTPSGYKLGRWIEGQHALRMRKTIDIDRSRRLEDIPGWSWQRKKIAQRQALDWDDAFSRLVDFASREGHVMMPRRQEAEDGFRIGSWVNHQRNSQDTLPDHRRRKLEELPGWQWAVRDARQVLRESMFQKLGEFVKHEGHARVPVEYETPDGFRLGGWIQKQRSKADRLPSDFKSRLEGLPAWTWDVLLDRWEEGFQHLLDFATREGHARVRAGFVEADGFKLGRWVQTQRKQKQKQKFQVEPINDLIILDESRDGNQLSQLDENINQERIDRLESVSGWVWAPKEEKWEVGLLELLEYVRVHGHAKVPLSHATSSGFWLGRWVASALKKKGRSELGLDQMARLEAVPGWSWGVLDEAWEEGFRALEGYVASQGDSHVPRGYVTNDGFRLGTWIDRQRRSWLDRRLDQNRADRLVSISDWSWELPTAPEENIDWEAAFAKLLEYANCEGHAIVPQAYKTPDGFHLGAWAKYQRKTRIKIPLERKRKLEELPGWKWSVRVASSNNPEWDFAFGKLLDFAMREGHAMVPRDYQTLDGLHLGEWVRAQRKSRGRIPLDRKRKLDGLPSWKWTVRMQGEILWENSFRALKEYVESERHARVPKDFRTQSGFRLGAWVQAQRSDMARLPLDRKARLEALPGWTWNALLDRWEEGFRHISEFAQREGHARVIQGYVAEDGYRLGSWAQNQRAWRWKMSRERAARLESLPGWKWATDSLQWDDWINLLKEFAGENGHTRVPQLFKTSNGLLLGRWVNSRRTSRDRLTGEQQAELESLPGWVWRVT